MLTYVAGTVGRLEESVERGFRETRGAIDDLRRETATKSEHLELKARVAAIEAAREQERRDQLEADRRAASDARAHRWQRGALWLSSGLALLGTGAGVVLHFT